MPSTSDIRQALVLLVLEGLERRSLTSMREYEVHQLVRRLQTSAGDQFRYFDAPISFSFELHDYLDFLERGRFIDELILVRDGWVPRYEYTLTAIGRAEANEQRDRLRMAQARFLDSIENELDVFVQEYKPPTPINPRWLTRQTL